MNSHEVFIHIHQGCFAGTGAIVRLPQCQWSKPDGYGKISQCITTTKHSKAKTVCIFLGIYCISFIWLMSRHTWGNTQYAQNITILFVLCLHGILLNTEFTHTFQSCCTSIEADTGGSETIQVKISQESFRNDNYPGVLCQKHVARVGTSNYIPQILWDVITCLCPWYMLSLRWRHNGHDSVSNHQPYDCLLNHLFRRRSKKTSKLRVTGLCAGKSPGTGEFPAQMTSNAENVSIWWRHHVFTRVYSM